MLGYRFSKFDPSQAQGKTAFDKLFDIFQQLINITGGDVSETLDWMNELDRQYKMTDGDYGMGDFIQDLKDKGYIKEEAPDNPNFVITAKTERSIRESALEEVFGKLKKGDRGQHKTNQSGQGDEPSGDYREYNFGDSLDQIAMTESLRNAQINQGLDSGTQLTERDLMVQEQEYKTSTSTVLMIDISHSMILYGEDRITPAKKVAMALSEFITTRYPKDTLDIIVFGNDAWPISIKDLPYLQVGPYHTNTVAGLELADDLLRRSKNRNKRIMMITDGKPTCLKEEGRYYKNSFGLDRKIIGRTLFWADRLRKNKVSVTTFMIASDPYLKQFVEQFTEVNKGRAYYSNLKGLGQFVFQDFEKNRRGKR